MKIVFRCSLCNLERDYILVDDKSLLYFLPNIELGRSISWIKIVDERIDVLPIHLSKVQLPEEKEWQLAQITDQMENFWPKTGICRFWKWKEEEKDNSNLSFFWEFNNVFEIRPSLTICCSCVPIRVFCFLLNPDHSWLWWSQIVFLEIPQNNDYFNKLASMKINTSNSTFQFILLSTILWLKVSKTFVRSKKYYVYRYIWQDQFEIEKCWKFELKHELNDVV